MRLQLRASPVLTFLVGAAHGVAGLVLVMVLPPAVALASVAVVGVLAWKGLGERTLLRSATSPSALLLERDGSLSLQLRGGGEPVAAIPAPRRYVSRWLVVLDLALPSQTHRTILVARDMLAPGEFRQLCLWALWETLPAAPAGNA